MRACVAYVAVLLTSLTACGDDTLKMAEDVRRGLRLLFDRLAERGWAPHLESIEVIDA